MSYQTGKTAGWFSCLTWYQMRSLGNIQLVADLNYRIQGSFSHISGTLVEKAEKQGSVWPLSPHLVVSVSPLTGCSRRAKCLIQQLRFHWVLQQTRSGRWAWTYKLAKCHLCHINWSKQLWLLLRFKGRKHSPYLSVRNTEAFVAVSWYWTFVLR